MLRERSLAGDHVGRGGAGSVRRHRLRSVEHELRIMCRRKTRLTVYVCLGSDGRVAGQDSVDVGKDDIWGSIWLEILAEPLVC